LLIVLGLGLAHDVAWAAGPTPSPSQPAEVKPKPSAREKRLRDKVGLDEAKAKKVMALLDAQRAARKPVRAGIKKAFEALEGAVRGGEADDAALVQAAKNVQAARDKLQALERSQLDEVLALLTPKEQARYMLTTRKNKKRDGDAKAQPKAPHADPSKDKDKDKDDDDGDDGAE